MVQRGEIELFAEAFGDDDRDPVVLISGADAQCVRWRPSLIDALVGAGRRVIRFDNRDCGLSTHMNEDEPYRLADMAEDTLAVMDAFDVGSAHLIGRSMGGMIAQVVALDHPDRVRSLTLLCSSPGVTDDRLPGPSSSFVGSMSERLFAVPPGDRAGRIAWLVDLDRLFNGSRFPFDGDTAAELAALEVDRSWYPESGQGAAVYGSPSRLDRLGEITATTLIVHGTEDPVLPIEHAHAMAEGIVASTFVEVEGLGHEIPDALIAELVPTLLAHLA